MEKIYVEHVNEYTTCIYAGGRKTTVIDNDIRERLPYINKRKKVINGILLLLTTILLIITVNSVQKDKGHWEPDYMNPNTYALMDIDGDGDYFHWVE